MVFFNCGDYYLVPYHTACDLTYAVLLIPETVSYVVMYILNV